jgi:tRNA threonylcarbamoyl adenosine modification protein YeaZ/ribosomal-protein-alanine acetyltransferase
MNILALDTSMQACSAAVLNAESGTVLASRRVLMDRGHAEAVAPMVASVLEEAKLSVAQLDRIAVTTGPGTFTGVRIGLAMARGLGCALKLPVCGVSTLRAIAANAADSQFPAIVANDARLGEIYVAVYSPEGEEILPPSLMHLDDLSRSLPEGRFSVLGTAADSVLAMHQDIGLLRSAGGDLPDASAVARLAAQLPEPQSMPSPLYLRSTGVKPPSPRIELSRARADSVFTMAEIHAASFASPWEAADFARLVATPGALSVLAHRDREPAAFILCRAAGDEAEILTIATHPSHRREGIARRLLDTICSELSSRGVVSLFLEVSRSNMPALAMYRNLGFSEAGVRRDYYQGDSGNREDAIIMRKTLAR